MQIFEQLMTVKTNIICTFPPLDTATTIKTHKIMGRAIILN